MGAWLRSLHTWVAWEGMGTASCCMMLMAMMAGAAASLIGCCARKSCHPAQIWCSWKARSKVQGDGLPALARMLVCTWLKSRSCRPVVVGLMPRLTCIFWRNVWLFLGWLSSSAVLWVALAAAVCLLVHVPGGRVCYNAIVPRGCRGSSPLCLARRLWQTSADRSRHTSAGQQHAWHPSETCKSDLITLCDGSWQSVTYTAHTLSRI